MKKKKYRIQTSCPQCGCSAVSNLTEEEIKERYGNVPNVEMECGECMAKYQSDIRKDCYDWDLRCKMEKEFPELYANTPKAEPSYE